MKLESRWDEWTPSLLGLGTSRLATPFKKLPYEKAVALVETAKELGVNFLDTADSYGAGEVERLLARILKHHRENFIVTTKAGYRFGNFGWPLRILNPYCKKAAQLLGHTQNFSLHRISACIDNSLARLGIEEIDLFLLHDPPEAVVAGGEIFQQLAKAKSQGKIRHFGVSSSSAEVISQSVTRYEVTTIQAPFTLFLGPDGNRLPRYSGEQKVRYIVNHVSLESDPPEARKFLAQAGEIASELGIPVRQVCLRFASALPGVSVVLTGTQNPNHLAENVRAIADGLPERCLQRLSAALPSYQP